jgi:hypothetical protein
MILTDKSKGWAGWELRSGDVAVSSSPLCSARVRDVGLVVQLSLVLLLVWLVVNRTFYVSIV